MAGLLRALGSLALSLAASSSSAGAWTQPAGKSWLSFGLQYQATRERYFLDGERIAYFFEGRSETWGAFLDYRRGLPAGLELGAQLGFFRIRFDDLAAQRLSSGPGDLRLGVRWNAFEAPLLATLGARVKLPTGDFQNDAEIVPVGEGQADVDLTLELGRSLWPRPGYVTGLVGYRIRAANDGSGIDPGDELFWSVEAGYRLSARLGLKTVLRGLHGREARSFGLPLASRKREVLFLDPGLVYEVDRTFGLQLAAPVTLRGRNWPAGVVLSLGAYKKF